jgi:hypothetical protein
VKTCSREGIRGRHFAFEERDESKIHTLSHEISRGYRLRKVLEWWQKAADDVEVPGVGREAELSNGAPAHTGRWLCILPSCRGRRRPARSCEVTIDPPEVAVHPSVEAAVHLPEVAIRPFARGHHPPACRRQRPPARGLLQGASLCCKPHCS